MSIKRERIKMAEKKDAVWKSEEIVKKYLTGTRGAIPLAKEQLDIFGRVMSHHRPSVGRFLDIGCGDGIMASVILEHYPDAKGVLVDFSPGMIEAAKERMAAKSQQLDILLLDYGNKDWNQGKAFAEPFDVIASGLSIHHQPDERKKEIFREIYEMLSPGGVFVNLEHVAPAGSWGDDLFDNLMIDSFYRDQQKKGTGLSRDEVHEKYISRAAKEANLLSPVELQCQWLREIGFVETDCFFKAFELAIFGGWKPETL
jgi:SAM-dependent methyltransferase